MPVSEWVASGGVSLGTDLDLFLKAEISGERELPDRVTREPAADEAERVMYSALRKGLSFKVTMGNIVTLTPPLTITMAEMSTGLDILKTSLSEL